MNLDGYSNSNSNSNSRKEDIITVLFDRSEFSERSAREWWIDNKDRLL